MVNENQMGAKQDAMDDFAIEFEKRINLRDVRIKDLLKCNQ